jgi:integrase
MSELFNNFPLVAGVLWFSEFIDEIVADPRKDQRFKFLARLAEIDSLPLNEQLKQFHKFMTDVDVRQRQGGHLRDVTANNYLQEVRNMLGGKHRYGSPTVPLEQLSLTRLVSSSGLTFDNLPDEDALNDVMDDVYDYLSWRRNERDIVPGSELQAVKALIRVAAYLYHPLSKNKRRSGRSTQNVGYRDIPIIEELRELQSEIVERNKNAPKVADEEKKWIEWPEFLAMVEQLKTECNPIGQNNRRRSDSAIAASIQRYLIAAFLSAILDRQRTFRELEEGRTLFQRNGIWRIEHGPDDFKTGSTYCKKGEKRIIPIPNWFYPELEAWLHGYEDQAGVWHGYIDENGNRLGWRAVFKPNHSCVFTQKCGNKMTSESLNDLFRHAAYRITGQACHPHLVRDMIVTYLKRSGASSDVLEALAKLMAHSLQMQQNIYDRRTPEEKIQPAIKALDSLRGEDLNS